MFARDFSCGAAAGGFRQFPPGLRRFAAFSKRILFPKDSRFPPFPPFPPLIFLSHPNGALKAVDRIFGHHSDRKIRFWPSEAAQCAELGVRRAGHAGDFRNFR
jgi:hypothetical protein